MKKILLLLFILASLSVNAQSIVDSIGNTSFLLKDTISDKLADLAVTKNPLAKIEDKKVEAGLYEWKRARSSWANNFNASFNLNEGNLRSKDSTLAGAFFPRYNFNMTVPLNILFGRRQETKKARAQYEGTLYEKEANNNALRQEIKTAYQLYIANKYLLALQESILQDESVLLSQVQQQFENNKVGLEPFTNANRRYNAELVRRLTLLRDVNTSKIALEGLLGMNLETAMAIIGVSRPKK